jgi:hypothetical protein
MSGQQSLNNFYQSVKFSYPRTAVIMSDNIITVALNSLADDKSAGQAAAERLRDQARAADLPEALNRVLENALDGLGYE